METDAEKTVFISYRRAVSAGWARAIFGDLDAHGYDVFMDVESIDSGTFETIILNQIAARAHFLILLTPGSVERCVEPGDWLRREIEHAMALERNVVPVLLHGFEFGQHTKYLTGQLSQLSSYNGLTVPHDYFDAAMEKLRSRFLKQPVRGTVRPTPVGEQAEVRRKVEQAARQPAPTEAQLTAEQWFERGLRWDEKDYTGKISLYTEAIRLNPLYAIAYYYRGTVRYEQGDLAGALADYEQTLRLDPQYTLAYMGQGIVRMDQGDQARALADLEEFINRGGGRDHGNQAEVERLISELKRELNQSAVPPRSSGDVSADSPPTKTHEARSTVAPASAAEKYLSIVKPRLADYHLLEHVKFRSWTFRLVAHHRGGKMTFDRFLIFSEFPSVTANSLSLFALACHEYAFPRQYSPNLRLVYVALVNGTASSPSEVFRKPPPPEQFFLEGSGKGPDMRSFQRYPVIVDVDAGSVYFSRKSPILGLVAWPALRKEINELLVP